MTLNALLLALPCALAPAATSAGPEELSEPAARAVEVGEPRSQDAELDPAPATVRLAPEELALAAGVDATRAARSVRELVALGTRMGGTASGRRARDQRLAWVRELGLEPRVLADGVASAYEPLRWRVVATVDDRRRDLTSAWPMLRASAVRATGLPLSLEPTEGGALLNRTGGAGRGPQPTVVLADGRSTADGHYAQIRQVSPDNPPVLGLGRRDGAFLRAALERGADVRLDVLLECEAGEAEVETVVGVLPAAEGAPPGHLLICAHGDADSGGPGANDNGSGEAIVLEIARAWSTAVAEGRCAPPAVELRFAWWGSEIFSSRAYLARALDDADSPLLGVLNFDQCGYGAGPERLFLEPDDLPANEPLVRMGVELLSDAGGADGFPERFTTVRSLGGTDSYSFSGSPQLRERGVPSITIYASAWGRPAAHPRTQGMPGESWNDGDKVEVDHDPWYHSSGDLPTWTTDVEPWHLGWQARTGAILARRYAETLAPR